MNKNICIIGGAGFIGSNATRYFLEKGWGVIVFDNFSRFGAEKNLKWLKENYQNKDNFKVVREDITKESGNIVLGNLMEKVDYVLHLAAQVAVTTSVVSPREDFLANALGTFNVLEAIRRSKRKPGLIYASTNKVYGGLHDIKIEELETRYAMKDTSGIDENQNLDFHSPYGCSKGAADQYVRDYARIYGLRTIVCRQSCIYGPRQFGKEDQGWVAWFMIATALGKDITIFGNGKQVRDLLYVDDLVFLYDKLFSSIDTLSGKVFNVGGGPENTLSLLEFLSLLEERANRIIRYTTSDVRPGDQPIYVSDISKLKDKLGWEPSVKMPKGIDMLWLWVGENRSLFTGS